jgi:hypothetical protein
VILFIIKKSYTYSGPGKVSSGLRTSALFVVDMLKMEGHRAELAEAVDGNCIDRLVTEARPRIVILEAIWVTPAKLAELRRLHPHVRFVVRVHSEIPFLANEGNSIAWLAEYRKLGVEVAFNSEQAADDFAAIAPSLYLPNTYPLRKLRYPHRRGGELHVGCFGAVRPLKNQLIQALAAIRYAQRLGKKLHFHMNGSRTEQGGNSNLKAIEAAFAATGHELVLHPWLDHHDFLELVAKMDFCLQVSLSESFNIVSADAVSLGVPLIGSAAIRWLPRRSRAPVDSAAAIADKMGLADEITVQMNHAALEDYVTASAEIWNRFAQR